MTWYKKTYYNSAKSIVGNDGKIYGSKFEGGYANELVLRKRAGDIKDYQTQVNLPLIIVNSLGEKYNVGTYIADFIITHNDGSKEIVETKGFATGVFKQKWKIVEALYSPDYRITCVFMGKGKLRPAKKVIEY